MDGLTRRSVAFDDLTTRALHDILRLRTDVFVVEQRCPYPELDGRDDAAGTRHIWLEDRDGRIATYLRLLDEGDVQRIGRVVTASWARGRGLAGRLLRDVLREHPRETVLAAQAHLAAWYSRAGFEPDGAAFVEDGIPHLPMRRAAAATLGGCP